ncbi:MAG TPA: metallophosphoesterase [bacterium]|jgi:hypothetical protein|nr:metallophosphoesterase [bacterium]
MARKKGNPVLDPWYPWDFEKPRPAGARDGERFKLFLAWKTYLWYFIGYLLVPACLFHSALRKGWILESGNLLAPWTVWAALVWILTASRISKALPDSLLQGSLTVNLSRRRRLGTVALAAGLCLFCGWVFLKFSAYLEACPGACDWGVAFSLCPGLGFLVWGLYYVSDFVRGLFKKSPEYHLDTWYPKDFEGPLGKKNEVEVAHWSDIHLTARDGDTAVAGDKGDNEKFGQVLRAAGGKLKGVDILLASGDVADAGRASEWHVFFSRVPPALFKKMVLLPGNHDMNIVDPSDWFMVEGQGRLLRKKRLIRAMAALNRVQGKRAWIQAPDKSGKTQWLLLGNYLDGFKDSFREFLDELSRLQERKPRFWDYFRPPVGAWIFGKKDRLEALAQEVDRAWGQIFPMAVKVPGTAVVFLVFNSNKEDTGIVDNALGELPLSALGRLDSMREKFGQGPVLYSLHHHVALPHFNQGFLGEVQVDMMALLNAGDFIQKLLAQGPSVVFHGHRHIGYTGILNGKIQILSAPSTTLGNELEPKTKRTPGFYSFRVALKGPMRIVGRRFWKAGVA